MSGFKVKSKKLGKKELNKKQIYTVEYTDCIYLARTGLTHLFFTSFVFTIPIYKLIGTNAKKSSECIEQKN